MSHMTDIIYTASINNTLLLWGTNHLSVDIPTDAKMVIVDMWDNGGTQGGDTYVGMRVNGSSSNIYGRAGRAHNGTSYSYYNSTSPNWFALRVNTANTSGAFRGWFYPQHNSARYGQNQVYIGSDGGGTFTASWQVAYWRFISGADINSLQFYTYDGSSAISFDLVVRVIR